MQNCQKKVERLSQIDKTFQVEKMGNNQQLSGPLSVVSGPFKQVLKVKSVIWILKHSLEEQVVNGIRPSGILSIWLGDTSTFKLGDLVSVSTI